LNSYKPTELVSAGGYMPDAQEDLEDGYINIDLWRQMLRRDKAYLRGRIYELQQQLNELSTRQKKRI